MNIPIFQVVSSNSAVTGYLGVGPVRFWKFGRAPQNPVKPYAVWQTVSGNPENYLGSRPNLDQFTIQIDVYSDTATNIEQIAEAIRDAIEDQAYVTSWRGEDQDTATKLYRYSFDVDWIVDR